MTGDRYHFERFSSDMDGFDRNFSDFLNRKYGEGWKYKNCQFHMEEGSGEAFCLFKKV